MKKIHTFLWSSEDGLNTSFEIIKFEENIRSGIYSKCLPPKKYPLLRALSENECNKVHVLYEDKTYERLV